MSVRAALREATRGAHDRVDALYSRYDLADLDQYRAFLMAQAAAFLPCEEALTAAGAARLVPDWPAMVRGPSLLADLDALGAAPPERLDAPVFDGDAEMLGGIYVLEGSRLGGALLRRSVPAHFPHAFLAHAQPAGHWREFVANLERTLYPEVLLGRAAKAAMAVFDLFEKAETGRAA